MLGLRSRGAETRGQATLWGTWPGTPDPTWSGVDVNRDQAMRLLAVYGSTRMISDGISTMPVDVYRERPDGTTENLPTPKWLEYPTVDLTFEEWCSQIITSLLLDGNSYITVTRNDQNSIVELIPLANDTVSVRREAGKKQYIVAGQVFPGELLHIKAMMLAGSDVGLSPVEYARQTIGLGLGGLKFGAQFFDGPGNMPGVIEAPYSMQPAEMTETTKAWQRFRRKGGQGLPGILQNGAHFNATGVTNEQAQFLATRQWSAAEIAGQMFLLDPTDLGIPVTGTSLTYANLAERNTRRVQVGYLPWMVRIEKAISRLLFSPRYMKFNADGLLRGNLKEQYEAFAIGLAGAAFLDVDEVREKIDLPAMDPAPPATPPVPVSAAPPARSEPDVHVHVTTPDIHLTAPEVHLAPVWTVRPPDVRVEVAAPEVHVDAPVINVEAAPIPKPLPAKKVVRTVERDDDGRILRVVEN